MADLVIYGVALFLFALAALDTPYPDLEEDKMSPRAVSYTQVVGTMIRVLRINASIDLSKMALDLGYTHSGYSRIETGDTVISVNMLYRVCLALKIGVGAFFQQVEGLIARASLVIVENRNPDVGPDQIMALALGNDHG